MNIYDKGMITLLLVSLVLMAIAVPLIQRKVPPNTVYGFRTRATLADETIWYDANAHFGRGLIRATLLAIAIATPIYLLQPFPGELFMPVSILLLAGPSVIATLATLGFVRRQQKETGTRRPPHLS